MRISPFSKFTHTDPKIFESYLKIRISQLSPICIFSQLWFIQWIIVYCIYSPSLLDAVLSGLIPWHSAKICTKWHFHLPRFLCSRSNCGIQLCLHNVLLVKHQIKTEGEILKMSSFHTNRKKISIWRSFFSILLNTINVEHNWNSCLRKNTKEPISAHLLDDKYIWLLIFGF